VESGIFEAGVYGNVAFVAQELAELDPLEGFLPRDRRQQRREGLYPNLRLAQALLEAASGLQAIHAAGLVHGHLTTDSLRQTRHGQVRLTGLGEEPLESTQQAAPPGAGARCGTQRDVFDLAAAFVELVTGSPPELSEPPRQGTLARQLRRQNRRLSPQLAAILGRCLAPTLKRGITSAQGLVKAVAPLTDYEIVQAGWFARIATHIYDLVILGAPIILLTILLSALSRTADPLDLPWPKFLFVVFLVYALCDVLLGWSPGRRVRGLYLADSPGQRPRRWLLLIRCLVRFTFVAGILVLLDNGAEFVLWVWSNEVRKVIGNWREARHLILFLGGIPFATITLYLTSLLTPNGLPFHDFLTGVSWYIRRRRQIETVFEAAPEAHDLTPFRANLKEASSAGYLDQYELRGLLGQGGMGAVFAGYDTTLQRTVALKVLNASLHDDQTLMQRFEREARLAAQLSHPNVARVFGVGQKDGKPYMVMEFIAGETLQQLVERSGPLPLARAWDYITQAARALREAARLGIVHRDIKPQNLMLVPGAVLKVTDFGLSRALGESGTEAASGTGAAALAGGGGSLTKTGALMGTPQYMSPEQARAEKLDARSDIYSLGLTLYYLLSGRPPFEDDDVYDLVMKQCTAEPAALEGQVPDLTWARAALLRRMIANDRTARVQNYDDLLAELEALAPQPTVYAGLAPRFAAETINGIGLFGLFFSLGIFLPIVWILFIYVIVVIYVVGVGWLGTTPGKWLLRLRVVRPDGGRVGLWRALVRALALHPIWGWALIIRLGSAAGLKVEAVPGLVTVILVWMGLSVPPISALFVIRDKRHRGLHDRLAGTVVVQLPKKGRRKERSGNDKGT
jgi:serine/threonine protein kinase